MSLIEGQLEVDRAVPFIALGGVIYRSIREGKESSRREASLGSVIAALSTLVVMLP